MAQLSTRPCKLISVGSESEQKMFEHNILCLARSYITTVFKNNMNSVLPWLKWLVTDLLPRRAMLDTRAVFVEWQWDRFFSWILWPFLVIIISLMLHICIWCQTYILITDSVSKQNTSFLWQMKLWTLNFVN
jgi:hypothetical protein